LDRIQQIVLRLDDPGNAIYTFALIPAMAFYGMIAVSHLPQPEKKVPLPVPAITAPTPEAPGQLPVVTQIKQ